MKSSTGVHFIALDHIRAIAAFMVFTWHFIHASHGYPVSFEFVPAVFPLSLLDEGHVGVALFMTLSGYLFAKLLDRQDLIFWPFIWNRALRLLPLLFLVILIIGLGHYFSGNSVVNYAKGIAQGILLPMLPNGGWSITVEFHFYVALPLLLWSLKRSKWLPLAIICLAIFARIGFYHWRGEAQTVAYWTIGGRIDQFMLGMLAFHYRTVFQGRHAFAVFNLIAFAGFYTIFNMMGGFYQTISYPSPSVIWITLTTVEGLAFAMAIAWYDCSFNHSSGPLSKFLGRLGEYSYSIYLLHFFIVFRASNFIHTQIMDLSNFYIACLWSLPCFILMVAPGYLSFRFIEAPFLKFRKKYTKPA